MKLPKYIKRGYDSKGNFAYFLQFTLCGIEVNQGPYQNPYDSCEAKIRIECDILNYASTKHGLKASTHKQ